MAAITICSDFGAPKNKVCHAIVCPSICHELMGLDAMILAWIEGEVTQWCPTLCDCKDYNLPVPSIHGIFQVRILEWVTISFSRGTSGLTDGTHISFVSRGILDHWATKETLGFIISVNTDNIDTYNLSRSTKLRQAPGLNWREPSKVAAPVKVCEWLTFLLGELCIESP